MTLMVRVAAALLALCVTSGQPGSVRAAESSPIASPRTVATIVTGTNAVTAGHAVQAALRLRLSPGWHTYWQNPGDAGIAPNLSLTLPTGSQAGPIQWPLPRRLAEGTLTTYAYTGDVILPFTIIPVAGELAIKAHADWLVCRDICVPEEADLTLNLPAGAPAPSAEAGLISAALARVPAPAPFETTLGPDGTLTLMGNLGPTPTSAEFFPTAPGSIQHAAVQTVNASGSRLTIHIDPLAGPADTAASEGVLALTDGAGVTSAYVISPKRAPIMRPEPLLAPLLVLALGGGLLLNLMPCVFPILAMKAVALARLAGPDMRRVRLQAGSYSLGVVGAFVALGAGLVALRSAGQASGWGFQFQSATFVIAIAWLLFAIGLSLSGVFTVGGSLIGRGETLTRKGGHLGSFLTGVLAVVVASPCTAPFMGTAIAGALTLPAASALTIFAALGMGLALPYALIALTPGLSAMLPRPGRWMQTLQQLLAFPMYAAAVWLVWVVSQQAGPAGVLTAGAGSVVVGLAAWARGHAERETGRRLVVANGTTLAMVALLGALLYSGTADPGEQAEAFTAARLDELRQEGRPVFVNMTASWCLSCLVNERFALSPTAVRHAFAQSHVAYLKGDWTNANPAISAFLHQHGQDGVPLYVLYAPGHPPLVLPQILSETTVLSAIADLGS